MKWIKLFQLAKNFSFAPIPARTGRAGFAFFSFRSLGMQLK